MDYERKEGGDVIMKALWQLPVRVFKAHLPAQESVTLIQINANLTDRREPGGRK